MNNQQMISIHENAYEFFKDLAENHSMYGDTVTQVIHDFIREWEVRDNTPTEDRITLPEATHDETSFWDVWMEGYRATGDHQEAQYLGRWHGTFVEAVQKALFAADFRKDFFDREKVSWWGCRFFDNEADARREFG